jgi:hypothetical protein
MDNMGVVEGLQHLKLIVDHSLVPSDVFLQDDFNRDLLRAGFCLANNAVGAGT